MHRRLAQDPLDPPVPWTAAHHGWMADL